MMLVEVRARPDYVDLLRDFPQIDLETQRKLFHCTQKELTQWVGETCHDMITDCLQSGNEEDIPLVGKAANFLSAFLLLGNRQPHQLTRHEVINRAAALKERLHLLLLNEHKLHNLI